MNSRERILAALNGQAMDRIPVTEIGFWPETVERWHREGLPEGIEPCDYFGMDKFHFFTYDGTLQIPSSVICEDEETKTYTDPNGCTYKAWKSNQGTPLFLDSMVRERRDWEQFRSNLKADFSRFENVWGNPVDGAKWKKNQCEDYKDILLQDGFSVLTPQEPCWFFLRLLGEVEALMTMAADPDFAEEIISYYNDFNMKMVEEVSNRGYKFDAMWVFSDLSYKNGMLFSPSFFRQRVLPYQKKFFALCKSKGMKVIFHSDGNVHELLPLLIEAGIDCIQPMEARAGNNVIEYSRLYGDRISFIGNISADVLSSDKEQIYAEISEKVGKVKGTRRYLFHSDHSIPPSVSFENYCYAIELAKKFGSYE